MKNFYRLLSGINVMPAMMELQAYNKWGEIDFRTATDGSPHAEGSDILMRFNEITDIDSILNDLDCKNYPAMFELPRCADLVFMLMAAVRGERLGRCIVSKLRPGAKIHSHVDGGLSADYYDRYHIVLNGCPGSIFCCGDEKVSMSTGEVWWFNNIDEHSAINNSADDRIHIIADIRLSRVGE